MRLPRRVPDALSHGISTGKLFYKIAIKSATVTTHGDIEGVRSAGLGAGADLLGAGAATNELRG